MSNSSGQLGWLLDWTQFCISGNCQIHLLANILWLLALEPQFQKVRVDVNGWAMTYKQFYIRNSPTDPYLFLY